MYRVRVRWLALAVLVAGCGDNRSPCDYAETDDGANATTAETSGIALASGVHGVCGAIDPGHYDAASKTVDIDRYRLAIGGDGRFLLRVASDASATLLTRLSAKIFDTSANPTLRADVAFTGDHGAQIVELPAGDYDLVVAGTATGEPSGPIPYQVELVLDPACARASGAPYQESTGNNDAIGVSFSTSPPVSSIDGTAEDTRLVATANNTLHLAGTIDGTAHTDSYDDRDSYAFRTDGTANELTVRLDWTDAAADLDFYLFDPGTLETIAAGDLGGAGTLEIRAFAVAPSTAYVLWVGGYKGTHAPATYDVTVCGTHFFH